MAAPGGLPHAGPMTLAESSSRLPTGAIVVGYDETAVAGRALDWATDHAAKEDRPLVVVHATGSLGTAAPTSFDHADPADARVLSKIQGHGETVLAGAIRRVTERRPGVALTPLLVKEDPAPELLHLSRAAALVVVGSRGHGISRSVPTGQVGTWLARRTCGPVVVVPDFDLGVKRHGVLAGVRLGHESEAVLAFAFHYASVHDLPLTIAHVSEHTSSSDREEQRRSMANVSGVLGEQYPDVRLHHLVVTGRPARKLLDLAERMDLLVIGQHRSTGLHASPFGHVRSSIVDRSTSPTAVVPVHVAEPT